MAVSDQGPGLSIEDQERIFERFYRADPSRVRNGGEGSGLGLSIVKSHVESLGGRVSIHSDFGHGTNVTVVLPRPFRQPSVRHGQSERLATGHANASVATEPTNRHQAEQVELSDQI